MAGASDLWQYETVDPEAVDWGSGEQSTSPATQPVVEDDDGNGQLRKRGRGRPAQQQGKETSKRAKRLQVINLDSSDSEPDVDSPGDLKIRNATPGSAKTRRLAASLFHDSPQADAVPRSSPCMGDAARRALEASRRLQKQVQQVELLDVAALDDAGGCLDEAPSSTLPLRSMRGLRTTPAAAAHADEHSEDDDLQMITLAAGVGARAWAQPSSTQKAPGMPAAAAAAAPAPAAGPDDSNKITLICKCRQGSVEIRVRRSDPLTKLLKAFVMAAADKGWVADASKPPPGMRLEFDGETLNKDDKVEELDAIEDGDTIDVVWKA